MNRTPRRASFIQSRKLSRFILLLIGLPVILLSGVTGKLSGTITDADDQTPIIGATIQLVGTNYGRISDASGHFIILNITPGNYDVKISFIGYETVIIESLDIRVDLTSTIEVNMRPAVLEGEAVVVTAATVSINMDLTASMAVITQEQFDALPIADVGDALALQAGVVGSGSNLNIRGGRSNEVAYLIDGMYVQDPLLGGFATDLGNDAIQEMSLLSGTFNAEYGNALSGVVNIVTREGGRHWSARVQSRVGSFHYGKDSLKAEGGRVNWLLSGPLIEDNLALFVSGEHTGHDGYLPFGFNTADSYFAKLTFTGISRLKVNTMYRNSWRNWQNYSHSWLYAPEQYYQYSSSSEQIALNLTHTLSERLFYEFRVSQFKQHFRQGIWLDTDSTDHWMRVDEYVPWNEYQLNPDAGNGHEFYSYGNPPTYVDSESKTIDVRGDMVWQPGRWNEIKTGIQIKSHQLKLLDIYDPQRDHPYIDDYEEAPFELAAYIQDKIEFPYLVINLGLRFDNMDGNAAYRNDPLLDTVLTPAASRSQISPRLGIAHPISDRTKIHFAYGHFFQNPEYQYLYENSQYDVTVREPLFGQPNLDAERTVAYEVGLSHQFNDALVGRFTAYYKDITGLIGTHYYPPYTDEAPNQYVGYTLIVNEDYANTKGFEVNLDYNAGRRIAGSITYTFSVAKGSASSEGEQYPGTSESTRLYFLDFDKAHGFNAFGSWRLGNREGPRLGDFFPFAKTEIGFILRASTGYPYTPSGRDVGFVELNSLRRPATYSIDIEAGREFPLPGKLYGRLFLEVLNLSNVSNIRYVYSDTGDPDYTLVGGHSEAYMRDPSNYGPPRNFRLGLTLGWE
ncbi:MAG: TonB-dependent receptor [Candidatus Marinimicrobia bacterium]|nr:TonB-dependent receptor [Candidatus Neomarinimicrobiota bacterium]